MKEVSACITIATAFGLTTGIGVGFGFTTIINGPYPIAFGVTAGIIVGFLLLQILFTISPSIQAE